MTILQVVTLIISSSAMCLSLFTYLKHDAKIKKQSLLINQFQLERLQKESDLEKRAIIESNVIKRENGKRTIKVYNKGKSIAKDVVVTFPGASNLIISKYPSPIDIKPQTSIEIYITHVKGSPDTLQINFEWQDKSRLINKDTQIIQI